MNNNNEVLEAILQLETRMDNRFDAIDTRFDAIDTRIDTLESNVNERFSAVDTRVDTLESNMNERFNDLESTIKEAFVDIGIFEDRIAEHRHSFHAK